jgi:hypothetical protein
LTSTEKDTKVDYVATSGDSLESIFCTPYAEQTGNEAGAEENRYLGAAMMIFKNTIV